MRPNIEGMKPYVPGEQPTEPGFVKLNANENPYPPSPAVALAIAAEAQGALNLYPDPSADAVRQRLAERFGLERDNFIVGNGGDDILTIATRCLVGETDALAYPGPTYTLYETLAELQGARIIQEPFPADFSIPPALFGNKARLTFLANPNGPSGTAVGPADIQRLAESLDGVLLVDEAYADFADDNCMRLVDTLPNLCVLRSFSKSFSLAGLRIGYLAGPRDMVAEFFKAKDSYNLNRLSIAAAAAALDDYDYMLANVARVRETRRFLSEALAGLGFDTYPSQTNFLWTRPPKPGAAAVYRELKARKILVRFWDRPGMRDYVRITVGTREQIDKLLAALTEILKCG